MSSVLEVTGFIFPAVEWDIKYPMGLLEVMFLGLEKKGEEYVVLGTRTFPIALTLASHENETRRGLT